MTKVLLTLLFLLALMAPARAQVLPSGGDLQKALNELLCGQTLTLEAGGSYVGNFLLPVTPCEVPRTVRSSRAAELPEGKRAAPADAPKMARLETPNVAPVLTAPPFSAGWRFLALEFTQGASVGEWSYNLVQLGDGDSAGPQKTLESVPHHLEFDRVIVRTRDANTGTQRGITLNSAHTTVRNSHISGIKMAGTETQALGGWNGPGPFLIENNYLEAAGINILFGGARPAIPGLVPSDIRIVGNHLFKPLSWREPLKDAAGNVRLNAEGKPLYWTVKNLLELKSARRVTISDNLMENTWPHAQTGWAIIFNTLGEDGPQVVIEDVEMMRNRIRNATNGINLRGMEDGDTAVRMRRVNVHDNLLENLGSFGPEGRTFQLLQGTEDVTLAHNTATGRITQALVLDTMGTFKHVRLRYLDNLVPHGLYGVFAGGGALGVDAMNARASGWALAGNALVGTPEELRAKYPGNFFPASEGEGAALKGTDGLPVGANLSAAPSPTPTPPPVTPTPTPTPPPVTPTPTPAPPPSPTPPPSAPVAARVAVYGPDGVEVSGLGLARSSSFQLTAKALDAAGNAINPAGSFAWASSSNSLATVTTTGKVTSKKRSGVVYIEAVLATEAGLLSRRIQVAIR